MSYPPPSPQGRWRVIHGGPSATIAPSVQFVGGRSRAGTRDSKDGGVYVGLNLQAKPAPKTVAAAGQFSEMLNAVGF